MILTAIKLTHVIEVPAKPKTIRLTALEILAFVPGAKVLAIDDFDTPPPGKVWLEVDQNFKCTVRS